MSSQWILGVRDAVLGGKRRKSRYVLRDGGVEPGRPHWTPKGSGRPGAEATGTRRPGSAAAARPPGARPGAAAGAPAPPAHFLVGGATAGGRWRRRN